jgi:hypothetical protein
MNQYAQSMLDMLGQVGKPIVSKQTTTSTGTSNQTQSANEGLDIGSLMMMLMLMLNKKKAAGVPGLDAGNEAANAYQYLAPAKTQVTPVEAPAATAGYPGAGTGNASPDLADALSGIVLSGYMNRNPNLMSPGSQLSTGSNPMARMTPAQLLQLMMG